MEFTPSPRPELSVWRREQQMSSVVPAHLARHAFDTLGEPGLDRVCIDVFLVGTMELTAFRRPPANQRTEAVSRKEMIVRRLHGFNATLLDPGRQKTRLGTRVRGDEGG